MGLESAWMVGDTPDDLVAARAAGVVPVGVCPPGEDGEGSPLPAALEAAGAARVLRSLDELEGMLP
jgi:phosphoglycolate phosphatase-like HAD superfamily hydrolase